MIDNMGVKLRKTIATMPERIFWPWLDKRIRMWQKQKIRQKIRTQLCIEMLRIRIKGGKHACNKR